MLISGHVRALIFALVVFLSMIIFVGDIRVLGRRGFVGMMALVIFAFIVDEALQNIYMVGKEDERSPLVMEIIAYGFFVVPFMLIDFSE